MTEHEEEKASEVQESQTNGQDHAEEDEVIPPEFTCGVLLAIRSDGQGVQFQIMEGPDFSRPATLQDMNMMGNHFTDHTRAVMVQAQVLNALENNKLRKVVGRNLRV